MTSLRIRTRVQVSLSSSEQEERDLGYPWLDVVNDVLTEGGSQKTYVPVGATNVSLPLGGVAEVKYLYIRTNARDPNETPVTLTFRKNSTGGEAIDVVPMGSSGKGILLLSTQGITALYVTNAGAVNMDVLYSVAGD